MAHRLCHHIVSVGGALCFSAPHDAINLKSSRPRNSSGLGGVALLIKLGLKSAFNFGYFFVAAEGFFDPAHYGVFGEICKRNEVFGALKSHAAIGAAGIGAVIGVHGVVGDEHKTVLGFAFELCDLPGKSGVSHGNGGDGVRLAV